MSFLSPPAHSEIRRLMIFFGLVYFAEGLGQAGGLINQPLMNYLKANGLTSDQVAQLLGVLTIPWVIKPLYGLISDFVPFLGYRRKSYLFLMNGLAATGFLWLAGLLTPEWIVAAMALTALGIASSDVLVDALMVERGQQTGQIKRFQSQQWMWFNIAAITTGILGGWLSETRTPDGALHTAALITACAPAAVAIATAFLVREEKTTIDLVQFKASTGSLLSALKSKTLWSVAGFLAFWNFSPSFGTPMYYHMVDNLKFDQYFIGQLGSVSSVGSVIGAFVFKRFLAGRFSTNALVPQSILLGTISTVAYLFLVDRQSAVILSFATGLISMIPLLTLLSLAAAICPPHAEGFTFAGLMSIFNGASQVSAIWGAHLYEHVLDKQMAPLIWISAAFTLAAFSLVPFLPKLDGPTPSGERTGGA
ncbi:MAG TPA: MFS transporter [Nitrospirales bacterium]|nr:MFS transporter [Nitrospirales bacterium]